MMRSSGRHDGWVDRLAGDRVGGVDVAAGAFEPSNAFAQSAHQTWGREREVLSEDMVILA